MKCKFNLINSIFCLALIIFLFPKSATAAIREPEFLGMKNWRLERVSGGFVEVYTTAAFHNPNKVGVTLSEVVAEVFLDKEKLGVIYQAEPVKIKKKSDFEIPLRLTVKLENKFKLIAEQMLKFLSNKGALLRYEGKIEVKKFGIPIRVKMEDKYELKAKDLRLFKNE